MAKSMHVGYSDTVFTGGGDDTATVNLVLNPEDFRAVPSDAGEFVAVNITTPTDQPEIIRISQRKIANIYANTDIDPAAYISTRSGTATLLELRGVIREDDSVDAAYVKLIPYRLGTTLSLPTYAGFDQDVAFAAVMRHLNLLFGGKDNSPGRINALMHGVLRPNDFL